MVSLEDSVLRVRFDNLSMAEQEALTIALYSRADSWLGWGESRESDNVLRSLGRIFAISMRGLKDTFLSVFGRKTSLPASPLRSPSSSRESFCFWPVSSLPRLQKLPVNPSICPLTSPTPLLPQAPPPPLTLPAPSTRPSFPANITTPSSSPTQALRKSSCTRSTASATSPSPCRKHIWSELPPFTSTTLFLPP